MPKPAHMRCTFKGGYGSTASPLEEWQFSINLPATGGPVTTLVAQEIADDLVQAYNGAGSLRQYLPTTHHTQEVDVRYIGENGLQPRDASGQFVGAAKAAMLTAGAGAATPLYPFQTALCVSLMTLRAGASGKGRFFLPAPSMAIESGTGVLSTTQVQGVVTAAVEFLNQINLARDGSAWQTAGVGRVAVLSSYGFASEVTGLRIGRALDTMRSRRGDMAEGYVVGALTA